MEYDAGPVETHAAAPHCGGMCWSSLAVSVQMWHPECRTSRAGRNAPVHVCVHPSDLCSPVPLHSLPAGLWWLQ